MNSQSCHLLAASIYSSTMCSHYQAMQDRAAMERHFGTPDAPDLQSDIWPLYLAPYLRRDPDLAEHTREMRPGQFGLLPHWAKDTKLGRQTYNARSETAATKPAFRDAWKKGQRCIVPAAAIFEPNWETGLAVPWRITHAEGTPLGIAGLWSRWHGEQGQLIESFTMLTVNATDHPLMRRFHRPEDEKRMVVVLEPADYDRWLDCPVPDMMAMMTRYPAELLTAEPAPTPARVKKSKPAAVVNDDQQSLL